MGGGGGGACPGGGAGRAPPRSGGGGSPRRCIFWERVVGWRPRADAALRWFQSLAIRTLWMSVRSTERSVVLRLTLGVRQGVEVMFMVSLSSAGEGSLGVWEEMRRDRPRDCLSRPSDGERPGALRS